MKYFGFVLFFCIGFCGFSQEQFTVYFDTNKFELHPAELTKLHDWIAQNKTSKILEVCVGNFRKYSGEKLSV